VAKKICVGAMTGSDQDIFGLTVSPDGRFAASATRGGVVQLWSLEKQTALAVVEKVSSQMFCARFGPDGRTIAVCGEAGVVKLIDLTYFDEHISAAERVDWATESRDTLEAP
jgi:WD40 repeat protein